MNARHNTKAKGRGFPCACPQCESEDALSRAFLIPWIVSALALAIVAICLFFPSMTGEASFYNEGYRTANGELFDKGAMTCALPARKFLGKSFIVTNTATGKYVVVRCNDVGPAQRLVERGRVIDLTEAAFRKIADPAKGLVRVRVQRYRRFNEPY